MALEDGEFVVFDVETTGLYPESGDRIVEIAAVRLSGLCPVERFYSLVDPLREISAGAYLVNGISPHMLSGAPTADTVLPRFMEFVKTACVVGHNVRFDLGFLMNEFKSAPPPARETTVRAVDTLRMARRFLPSLNRYSLDNVARALDIEIAQRHRAMADVELTCRVFERLCRLASARGVQDSGQLVALFGHTAGLGLERKNTEA